MAPKRLRGMKESALSSAWKRESRGVTEGGGGGGGRERQRGNGLRGGDLTDTG